jgi:membrane peptidoglycan carboxypeptidase
VGSRATVHRLWLLAAISGVAGVLLAGMLLPIVGGIGLVARAGANDFESLPSVLKESPLPQVSRILAADGSTIATFYAEDRIAAPLSRVPSVMQKAIIAIEDVRFYEHHGVDFKGAFRALLRNSSSGTVSQGGSTLTQQYVKNVLIEAGDAGAAADTLARKAREARYALALEKTLTKQQILERYLNIAYFGDGAYGVGTAAVHYFGVPVQGLSLAQSAMLAGLVQSPVAYDPALHPKAGRARRDVVLAQMLKYHFVTPVEYDAAVGTPVVLHLHKQGNGCEASRFPYFCDYVQHVIETSSAFGANVSARRNLLQRGGLTIRTTLDPKVQEAADAAVQKYVPARDRSGIAAAEAVVEPGTGNVRAIAVSSPYGSNKAKGQNDIDYAVDHAFGGGTGFQAGSTFKLFVLAAALKQGIPLGTRIYAPQTIRDLTGFTDCNGNSLTYSPSVSNAGDSERGTYNLVTGTWFSVNTFYAQLEKRTGLCMPVQLAEAMGVRPATGGHIHQFPSFVLGAADGYSPLDVAGAYATMAAHGSYCSPVTIVNVVGHNGRKLKVPASSCHQVVDPGLADTITTILHGVLTQRGATAVGVGDPGRPAAAKTGTAENNWASDFAGYVPQLAAAVWVGNPRQLQRLNGLTIGGRSYGQVFGATIAGPIWRDTLTAALLGEPVVPLPPPDPQYVRGTTVPIPDIGGLAVADAVTTLKQAGFQVTIDPRQVDSEFPQGAAAGTSPSGAAAPGSVVVLLVSNGHPPPAASPSPGTSPRPPGPPGSPAPRTTPTATPRPTKSPHKPH